MTTPEIQKDLEHIVSKYQILTSAISNDGKIDDKEQFNINTSLEHMKDDILKLAKNPEDLKNYITELNILVEKKGIPKYQIEELFAKEVSEYKTQIVDISKLPQVEQNNFNTDITQAYINKKEDCETCEQETKKDFFNTKSEIIYGLDPFSTKLMEYNTILDDIESQIGFFKRGETKIVRERLNNAKQILFRMEKVIRKNKRYDRKLDNGRFDIDVRDPNHKELFIAKMDIEIRNIKDLMSQTITGETGGSNKFIAPNVYPDKSFNNNTLSQSDKIIYEACTNGTGSTNSGIKAIGNLIDTKMAPWLDANVTNGKGTKVLTGAAKLGLLVANGALLWKTGKAVWDLVRGKGEGGREGAFKRLLINGGIFTALNFVDPEKALAKGKELRGRVSGDTSKEANKSGDIDMSSAVTAINSKDTSPEKKIQVYGSTVIGNGLAGITYAEAATNGIFACSGNKITNINTEALKEFYKTKYESKPEFRNTIIQYVNAIEIIQSKNPDLIKDVMNYHAITMNDLSKSSLSGTLMATHILDKLSKAKELEGIFGATTIDATLKQQDPKISETLGATQFDELVEGINKLSPEVKQQFIDKKIQFKTKEGQLYMQANGEEVKLNINKHTHALANKSGQFVEFSDGAKDVEELLQVTYNITETIHENKGKFMVDKPLFYNKDLGERGHTICATIGPREIDKPMSWVSGQYVKIFDAQRPLFGLLGDQRLEKFEDENVLARYTKYLNDLGIWKGDTSQDFIDNDIKTKIAKEHPGLSPVDQQKILENYLGLYNTRGDLGAFAHEQFQLTKEKVYQISSDFYLFSKNILGQGWGKLKTAAHQITSRTIEKGTVMLQFANGVRQDIRKWLGGFYPQATIDAFKKQIETASKNQRGLVGQSGSWILNTLLGTNFLGEEKNKTEAETSKKESEETKKNKEEGNEGGTSRELPTINEASYAIGHAVGSIPRKTAEAGNDVWNGLKNSFTGNNSSNRTNNTNQNNTTSQTSSSVSNKSLFEKGGETIGDIVKGTAEAGYNGLRGGKDGLLGKK